MKTTKNLIAICLIALFSVNLSQAQTADEVLNKYWEAVGGKTKWKELKSMVMTGKASQMGQDFPYTVYTKSPNKMKVSVSFQGKEIIPQAFDGDVAWGTNFMTMQTEKKSDEETKEMKEEAEFEPKFLDYAQKGHKVALEGKETIDGTECYKIKLTQKDGDLEYHFFDTDSNALIMSRSFGKTGQMKGIEIESYFSDYKEINGLMIPHSQQQKIKGQLQSTLTLESVKLNENIDDKVFTMPAGK
jgi:outer membrane lipoprotein-sorting protein